MSRRIYDIYPELELDRLFTPAEAAILTGVSGDKQRQARHHGFARFLRERGDDGKHFRYDWEEIVLWALFGEIGSYGFDLDSAGYFAARYSGLPEMKAPGDITLGASDQILYYDYRISPGVRDVPLYIFCYPQIGRPETFLNSSTGSGTVAFDGRGGSSGRFGFWLNYSDFQRRLLLRYESLRD